MVQYNMILHASLQWLRECLNSQNNGRDMECISWGFRIKMTALYTMAPHYINESLCVLMQVYVLSHQTDPLTHSGRVTHICVSKLNIISSDNGLSPGRRQAIIWTNAGIVLIRTLGTNFSEILSEIHAFSFKKMHLKMSSGKGGHLVSTSMC